MSSNARPRVWGVILVVLALSGACASRQPVPVVTTPAHPDFLYPTVPPAMQGTVAAEHLDLGWTYLQTDDLRGADREFAAALKSNPKMFPAHAGHGYAALARKDFNRAVTAFDMALAGERTYVAALVGRGQALLALGRENEALAAFEAALAADPTLADVQRRAEVLRFRNLQDIIEAARAAARSGRVAEARSTYLRAIAGSPGSAFLHRELGVLERNSGYPDEALTNLRRAVELDPLDDTALVQLAEILETRRDYAGAEAAYRKALELNPSNDLEVRLASVVTAGNEARLPPEFRTALSAERLTRGDLAALIGVRLEALVRGVAERQIVMTDTRGHWAETWIAQVASAGIMDPFENHTFQPNAAVRRGDLATAISRVIALVASKDAALGARLTKRPAIADMNQRHIQYPAAATVVAAGVMPLVDGDRFQPGRAVSGREAVDVLEKLRALAANVGL